ncbi:helix-turn-helix domain-containing protein [Rhizobium sp. C4]|uniref:helix-turn-helix domain-containing protein n=1 Tax=Rhizobium sp. C4 TaxID=1349800 RepID=UPI001E59FF99|nr:XRE family transcriptional regulator [Rhizobium sp. C4]MCD2173923.1 XRE family transcriptional regulator [Rhizobium sp. C4]
MKDMKLLKSEADYREALTEIETYFDALPLPGSAEADRFDLLAMLIEAYENQNWPLDTLDPIEFLQGFMENRGYSRADLAEVLGSRSRASEIMLRRRPLTLPMIQSLVEKWRIPADALIAPYPLADKIAANA